MPGSLQKLEWENTTRMLFFKHRGDLPRILEDLKNRYKDELDNVDEEITIEFVRKVIDKFKKQQKANDPYVAINIMDFVLMGTKQREVLWDIDDQKLEEHEFFYRSACCEAMARSHTNDKGEACFVCLKCGKACNAFRQPDLAVIELRRRLRVEKRKDEEQLVKAAECLGFGGEKAPIFKQQVNQVVIDGKREIEARRVTSKEVRRLPSSDQQLIESTENMDPRDRETIRKQLEKMRREVVGDGWPEEK